MFKKTVEVDTEGLAQEMAQSIVCVKDIRSNFIQSKNSKLYSFIKIRADGDKLLSKENKKIRYELLIRALESERLPFQVTSIPVAISTYELISYLELLKRDADVTNDARINLIQGEIEQVKELTQNGIREPFIYIKLWDKSDNAGAKKLQARTEDFLRKLQGISEFTASQMVNYEVAYMCRQFAELGAPIDDENNSYERVNIDSEENSKPISLINEITPYGITVKDDSIEIGGTVGTVYGVTGFPKTLHYMWLSKIMNCVDTVTSILYEPMDANFLADRLSDTVQQTSGNIHNARNRREQLQQSREMNTADNLIERVDGDGMSMGMCTILTMPFAETKERLKDVKDDVIAVFRKAGLKIRTSTRMQLEGFKAILPYRQHDKFIKQQFARLLPLGTFIGGSPFVITSLRDKNGILFAYSDGGAISLDTWYRGEDRTNTNFILTGKPGTGKSTTAKAIIENEIMRGTKVIIIDPQREYDELTVRCNGQVINMSGGEKRINLLEVTTPVFNTEPFDTDDEIERYMNSPEYQKLITSNRLSTHVKEVISVFRSYFSDATEVEMSALELAIIEAYKRKGITWDTDTSSLSAADYPIIGDVLNVLIDYEQEKEEYVNLIIRLKTMVEGAGKFMFNGHTNVDINAQVICFDVYDLQTLDNNVKSAQFLNLIQYAWKKMTEDRTSKYMLIVDEAYTLIDPHYPTPIIKLRDISKQCRKFESALGVITHDIVDLLHENIRIYGQAILSTATYKYFMGTDGKNLQETKEIFSLTDEQVDVLRKGLRGSAISFIGSMVFALDIYVAEYKMKYMGDAGGR